MSLNGNPNFNFLKFFNLSAFDFLPLTKVVMTWQKFLVRGRDEKGCKMCVDRRPAGKVQSG